MRDLFIIGCLTGLRYSDYSTIKQEEITKGKDGRYYIDKLTQKTGEAVKIPVEKMVKEIFEKYSNDDSTQLPRALTNQRFNLYIKEVCQLAGLTEKGRLVTHPEQELWECVSTHTARRSFATNLFLEGFPTYFIMKITGHRTERAFMGYIKVGRVEAAERLSEHFEKRDNQPKVVRMAG